MQICNSCQGHVGPGKHCYKCGLKGPPKLLLLLALLLSACTTDDAPDKCRDYISMSCSVVTQCTTSTLAQCEGVFSQILDCDKAVGVSDSYDRCMNDLSSLKSCSQVLATGELTLPVSCNGAIEVEE